MFVHPKPPIHPGKDRHPGQVLDTSDLLVHGNSGFKKLKMVGPKFQAGNNTNFC